MKKTFINLPALFLLALGLAACSTQKAAETEFSANSVTLDAAITALGNEYRMTVYATDVEKAASSQRAFS